RFYLYYPESPIEAPRPPVPASADEAAFMDWGEHQEKWLVFLEGAVAGDYFAIDENYPVAIALGKNWAEE
ncbi:MAG: hypothetical protein ACRD2L_17825, partial [Terriglobia bacterium]